MLQLTHSYYTTRQAWHLQLHSHQAPPFPPSKKKKNPCFRSPNQPYFFYLTLNFFYYLGKKVWLSRWHKVRLHIHTPKTNKKMPTCLFLLFFSFCLVTRNKDRLFFCLFVCFLFASCFWWWMLSTFPALACCQRVWSSAVTDRHRGIWNWEENKTHVGRVVSVFDGKYTICAQFALGVIPDPWPWPVTFDCRGRCWGRPGEREHSTMPVTACQWSHRVQPAQSNFCGRSGGWRPGSCQPAQCRGQRRPVWRPRDLALPTSSHRNSRLISRLVRKSSQGARSLFVQNMRGR